MGINSLETLRNGKVLIEAGNKEDIEILTNDIHEKCGDKPEVIVQTEESQDGNLQRSKDTSTQNVEKNNTSPESRIQPEQRGHKC